MKLRTTGDSRRLLALEREKARLQREIRRRKVGLDACRAGAEQLDTEFRRRALVVQRDLAQALARVDRAVPQLLASQAGPLSRRDWARVRRALVPWMTASGTPSPSTSPDAAPATPDPPPPSEPRIEVQSAPVPPSDQAPNARATFRRLVVALHPDRALDPARKLVLEQAMKELTRAYESEDVARLAELEGRWLEPRPASAAAPKVSAGPERLTRLTQDNVELRRQLRSLTARLKKAKRGVAPEVRGGDPEAARAELDQWLEEPVRATKDLDRLAAACESLANGETDAGEFLARVRPTETAWTLRDLGDFAAEWRSRLAIPP